MKYCFSRIVLIELTHCYLHYKNNLQYIMMLGLNLKNKLNVQENQKTSQKTYDEHDMERFKFHDLTHKLRKRLCDLYNLSTNNLIFRIKS